LKQDIPALLLDSAGTVLTTWWQCLNPCL